jgi:hypothetical protein
MDNNNNKPHEDFTQSKEQKAFLSSEVIKFLEYIKKTYPKEKQRAKCLAEKLQLAPLTDYTPKNEVETVKLNQEILDNLYENISKAKALVFVALMNEEFYSLEQKTIYSYFWALDEFISNAYNLAINF